MRIRLRVVHVWARAIIDERTTNHSVAGDAFTIPGCAGTIFERKGDVWWLMPTGAVGGEIWRAGERQDLVGPVPLTPGDWGVVRFAGDHELAFEVGPRDKKLPPPPLGDTGLSLPATLLAAAFHAALVAVVFAVASWPTPGEGALGGYMVEIGRPRAPRPVEPPPPPPKKVDEGQKPAAAMVETAGKSGGKGDKPRQRAPNARPDSRLVDARASGVLKYKESLSQISGPSAADARLHDAVAQVGSPGFGNGQGGGVGPENGNGASLRGGEGQGGGGNSAADSVSRGPVDVGTGAGGRNGHGAPMAPRISEVKVNVTPETPDGDFGGLTPEQVRAVVEKHRGALQYCFEKELQKNPKLSGKVVVNWRIDPGGSVTTAKIKSSTVSDPDVDDCLVRQVRKWVFPVATNGQVTDVRYPFVFSGH